MTTACLKIEREKQILILNRKESVLTENLRVIMNVIKTKNDERSAVTKKQGCSKIQFEWE